jgi:hypothetical protein
MRDKRLNIMTVCSVINAMVVEDDEILHSPKDLMEEMVFKVKKGKLVAIMDDVVIIGEFDGVKNPKKMAKRLNKALNTLKSLKA